MKKITAIILTCMLVMVGCGDSDRTGNKAIDEDLELESNQSLVIGKVTAIYGNEIILALAEKVDDSTANQNTKQMSGNTKQTNENTKQRPINGEGLNGGDRSVESDRSSDKEPINKESIDKESIDKEPIDKEPIDKESIDKEPIDKESTDKESINKEATDKEATDKEQIDKESTNKEQTQRQTTRYTLTGEDMTATIPVGTPVTTLLGTVTTFSRIAVDNTLQIVTEVNKEGEDVIVAIYIVG